MRTITLEEHFLTETYVRATAAYSEKMGMQFPEMQSKLLDLGAGRIAAMDEAGIDLQVLSAGCVRAGRAECGGRERCGARGE